MGDPFSAAASTASFVSLGIQVCNGLISYCRAWKSHDSDIEEALERLTDLELTLRNLSDILSVVESLDDSTSKPLHGAHQKIRSCTAALNKLNVLLMESESISHPAGILDKLHNVRLRSMFFFNKEKLRGFRGSVAETQSNLGSAIQTLHLHLAVKQTIAIEDLAADNRNQAVQMPDAVENTLIKHLDLYGRRFSMLQQDVLNASSEHAQTMQRVTQSISALQLGMIQRPSLIHSAYKEERRLQSQHLDLHSRSRQRCTCRALTKYKPLRASNMYQYQGGSAPRRWTAATFASKLVHRRDCPLFGEAEESKQFGFRISYSGPLLAGTIKAAMTMTHGSGGFSISPVLAFIPTVSSDAAAFKILNVRFECTTSAADMQATFAFRKQELSRLYLEGKASPRDMDEDGNTVLHKACQISATNFGIVVHSNTCELYFQFLRDLHELGAPLNIANAAGLTPLGVLVQMYSIQLYAMGAVLGGYKSPVTLLNLKMFGIGAELPMFTQESIPASQSDDAPLIQECTHFLDLAEAIGCNEISQAVLAKSRPWLTKVVHRSPESINQPNRIGQTPLHFSVEWPEGLRLLLDAGAAVDAADNFGSTPVCYAAHLVHPESINILGEADCALHRFLDGNGKVYFHSLLEHTILNEWLASQPSFGHKAIRDEAEAIVDAVIRLVAQRRRMLGALVRTSLDSQSVGRLQLSPETVLDYKASIAMSMLHKKIDIPESLKGLSPVGSTVYHMGCLNLRQAHVLWDAGFRDVDELDSLGQSSLMKLEFGYSGNSLNEQLEIVEWLVLKGADLHRRQSHAFQQRMSTDRNFLGKRIVKTDRASSVTALHYLASRWGREFNYEGSSKEHSQHHLHQLSTLTGKPKRTIQTVLTDPLPDCCNCACSIEGCSAYIMMVKYPVLPAYKSSGYSTTHARKQALRIMQAVAHLLNVDQPSLAWLRRAMLRFNTFERLRLRHTCCRMDSMGYTEKVIVEFEDEDDRREIREEQVEQVKKLEALLFDFDKKYDEYAIPLSEFLDGYWKDRMTEISREKFPIDQTQLDSIGVLLHETDGTSSQSSEDEEERLEEVDTDDSDH